MKTFTTFKISRNMYNEAIEIAKKIPIDGDKTIKKNLVGALGEVLWFYFLGDAFYDSRQSHDLIYSGNKLEIKSRTLKGSTKPDCDLEFLVPIRNRDQECCWYGFAGIHESHRYGWIFGYLPNEKVKNSKVVYKGESIGKIEKLETDNYLIRLGDMYNADLFKLRINEEILTF